MATSRMMNTQPKFSDLLSELFFVLNRNASSTNDRRIHNFVTCNVCNWRNIEGDRYLCTICDNYDMCSRCFCSGHFNKGHIPNHPCLCVPRPLRLEEAKQFQMDSRLYKLVEMNGDRAHGDINCRICRTRLRGVHIKCDICYQFDMCFNCWRNHRHDGSHPMLVFFSEVLSEIPFEKLSIVEKIGEGSFGEVYKAFITSDKNLVALKMVLSHSPDRAISSRESIESIINEMNAHREIRSAYLCKLFGYTVKFGSKDVNVGLILEYMDNGNLESVIKDEIQGRRYIPLLRKIKVMSDIANGLYDIHKKKFIHSDIKPDNILLDYNFNAKISDLGIIKNMNQRATNEIGNTFFLPNEFYSSQYDNRVDVFSFGLVMYYVFTRNFHEWSTSIPCESRRLVLNHLPAIRLEVVTWAVRMACEERAESRMSIDEFKGGLRFFWESCEQMLVNSGRIHQYSRMNGVDKDRVVMELSGPITNSIIGKQNLNLPHARNGGFSLNQLAANAVTAKDRAVVNIAHLTGLANNALNRNSNTNCRMM